MADSQSHHAHLPSELNARDPQFPQKIALSNLKTQCDIAEIVAATKNTIDKSQVLLAEIDRVLAKR